MIRLIDANALIDRMYHDAFETDTDMQKWDSGCWIRYKMFENAIDEAPSIEPKRGEWVNARDGVSDHVKCTNCFRTYYLGIVENYNFCPNCGAQMKGADDE